MSYLAASDERQQGIAVEVARKLLARAKEHAVERVFCASDHRGDYDSLSDEPDFFDDLSRLYSEYILHDDMDKPGIADIGTLYEVDGIPILSEKYEYASPAEVLDEIYNLARWCYEDLQYAAELTSRLLGATLSLPCFYEAINEVKDE